jgi:hypothetical protein
MKMNKKGAVPIIVWVIIAVVGLLLAKEAGLFTLYAPYTPTYQNLPPGASSLINNYFYDAVTGGTNWPCVIKEDVFFRTNANMVQNTGSSDPSNYKNASYWIALDVNNDGILEKFGWRYWRSDVSINLCSGGQLNINTPDGYKIEYDASPYGDLSILANDCHYYAEFRLNYGSAANAVIDNTPVEPYHSEGKEVTSNPYPVKDSGTYTCSGGNIVSKYCGDFPGNTLVETCPAGQQCTFIQSMEVGGIPTNIVKCGDATQKFKPSVSICYKDGTSEYVYSTSSTGIEETDKVLITFDIYNII